VNDKILLLALSGTAAGFAIFVVDDGNVAMHGAALTEALLAVGTLKGLLARVDPEVLVESAQVVESTHASRTAIELIGSVGAQVLEHLVVTLFNRVGTVRALEC